MSRSDEAYLDKMKLANADGEFFVDVHTNAYSENVYVDEEKHTLKESLEAIETSIEEIAGTPTVTGIIGQNDPETTLTGDVELNKDMVGLDKVDNTPDEEKEVLTATKWATNGSINGMQFNADSPLWLRFIDAAVYNMQNYTPSFFGTNRESGGTFRNIDGNPDFGSIGLSGSAGSRTNSLRFSGITDEPRIYHDSAPNGATGWTSSKELAYVEDFTSQFEKLMPRVYGITLGRNLWNVISEGSNGGDNEGGLDYRARSDLMGGDGEEEGDSSIGDTEDEGPDRTYPVGSILEQRVNVPGLNPDETAQLVLVTPASDSVEAYIDYNVMCVRQEFSGDESYLVFQAEALTGSGDDGVSDPDGGLARSGLIGSGGGLESGAVTIKLADMNVFVTIQELKP